MQKSKTVSLGWHQYGEMSDGLVVMSCRRHGSLEMQQKSEESDLYRSRGACARIIQDMPEIEGLL